MKSKSSCANRLIFLCWLVYATSYIGKLSYSANINRIGEAFDVSYSAAGIVTTFFFFVYGAGQIVNGFLCKRYNIKYVIGISLIVSATMNLLVGVVHSFNVIKYLWLINGAAMSFLWTSLIRLLSETLDREDIPRATVAMGTTVAIGTFSVYGISSAVAASLSYRTVFLIAATLIFAVAIFWFISYNIFTKPLLASKAELTLKDDGNTKTAASGGVAAVLPFLAVIAILAVSDNLIKDGLTSWTPDILAEIYDTPPWLSILLTLLLPALGILGSVVAVKLVGALGDYVLSCTVLFGTSSLLIGVVLAFISTPYMAVTVASFALVSCLMAGVNNIITSMIPLGMSDKVTPGKLAGILNGFCYLGSTVSAYGLGAIADAFRWVSVFYTLLGVSALCTVLGIGYLLANKLGKRV
ncbi:MAG: MFS transporter [Clostridia bacterium]|nr:MFS transporter [Clostridia bacterium]